MKAGLIITAFVVAILGTFFSAATPAAAAQSKVALCHVPPDNPQNFHTIVVSESARSAHLANHPGDFEGQCDSFCETQCPDDENLCTTAVCDLDTLKCEYVPVSCDDGIACTNDQCDPLAGCFSLPESMNCPGTTNECQVPECDAVDGCGFAKLTGIPCNEGEGTCDLGRCLDLGCLSACENDFNQDKFGCQFYWFNCQLNCAPAPSGDACRDACEQARQRCVSDAADDHEMCKSRCEIPPEVCPDGSPLPPDGNCP